MKYWKKITAAAMTALLISTGFAGPSSPSAGGLVMNIQAASSEESGREDPLLKTEDMSPASEDTAQAESAQTDAVQAAEAAQAETSAEDAPSAESTPAETSAEDAPSAESTQAETSAEDAPFAESTQAEEQQAQEAPADPEIPAQAETPDPNDGSSAEKDTGSASDKDNAGRAEAGESHYESGSGWEAESPAEGPAPAGETPEDALNALPDGLIAEEEGEEEDLVPVQSGSPDTDNDALFASYVNRELQFADSYAPAQPQPAQNLLKSPLKRSLAASRRLNEYNRAVYNRLLEKIQMVASGDLTYTEFVLTTDDVGVTDLKWTAEDLGVDSILVTDEAGTLRINPAATQALKALLGYSFEEVNKALLADCPYDLYWYDKTASSTANGFSYTAYKSEDSCYLKLTKTYTFRFPVSADYSLSGESGTCEVNPDTGSSVKEACVNAHAIVDQYKDCTDLEKLDAYRREICARTSYNNTAASSSAVPYGDPWQLIWALDDDRENQVVCEGYSKAFQYLCDLSDFREDSVECISVTGYLGKNLSYIRELVAADDKAGLRSYGHMWNIVTLQDGGRYLVDLTNCDGSNMGSGNSGRDLFLVGTDGQVTPRGYAVGTAETGYVLYTSRGSTGYAYDAGSFDRFGKEALELADGRISAEDWYADGHTHVYIPFEELLPTCTHKGHSSGKQCAVCDAFEGSVVEYPLTGHTPGAWQVTSAPTYEKEGTETASCTVCGQKLSRQVAKLVGVTGVFLDKNTLTMESGSTQTLMAEVLPENAHDKSLTWTSDNTETAQVSASGTVTAKNTGTARITARSVNGSQEQTAVCTIEVTPQDLSGALLTFPEKVPVYSGSPQTPEITVKDRFGNTLTEKKDYLIRYDSNIHAGAGTASVEITGINNYTGTAVKAFSIEKAAQPLKAGAAPVKLQAGTSTAVTVSGAKGRVTYTSSAPAVAAVSTAGRITAKKPGTVVITVTAAATADYKKAQKDIPITVTSVPLTEKRITVSLAGTGLVYRGTAHRPSVTVRDNGKTLRSGTDYVVTYKNNLNAGKASALITGKGIYSGTRTLGFTISRASVRNAAVSGVRTVVWTGSPRTLSLAVRLGTAALKKGTDYTVVYQNNKKVGRASVTIYGKGNYCGSTTAAFTINPKGTTISALTGTRKSLRVNWRKQPDEITGYQIQYSSNGFKTNAIRQVTGKTVSNILLTSLREKTVYSVRIRTYKVCGNVRYYSAWSPVKKVRTK